MPPQRRGTFHRRLLIGCFVLSVSIAALSAILLFIAFEENEREEGQAWMAATIVQVADRITPDLLPRGPGAPGDPDRLRAILADARNALVREVDTAIGEPIAQETILNLAVMMPTDDPDVAQVYVSLVEKHEGSLHDLSLTPERALAWEIVTTELKPSASDPDGLLYAYVPIRDEVGNPLAILRLDSDRKFFDELYTEALVGALLVFTSGALISLIISRRFSGVMARPVEQLGAGLGAVARGDLTTHLPPERARDEFRDLFEEFNDMVSDLRDRERIKRDVDAAAEIQRQLLPAARPEVRSYDIYGGARYCDEAGGDYFDFFEVGRCARESDDDPLGVIVADVTGHGLRAALPMVAVRAVLRSTMRKAGASLESAMEIVNEQVRQDAGAGAFVTAFAAILDPSRDSLTWLSAGHEPAIIWRAATRSIEELGATGVPLGIGDERVELGDPVRLAPGDIILIGTDGVRERRNAKGVLFGKERLIQMLERNADSSAERIWRDVIDEVMAFGEGHPVEDDITLLVLRNVRQDQEPNSP